MEEQISVEPPPAEDWHPPSPDLAARLVSAVVFAVVAIGFAWAGQKPFAVLVLAVVLIMSWEWGRIVRRTERDLTLLVHGLAVAAATILTALGYAAMGLAVLVIGAIIVLALEFGAHPMISTAGVLYTGLPAVALLWIRGDEPMGFLAVLFILIVVWTSDTAAFIVGRGIGGPRLAPRISPNKTWAGLVGGIAASALAAFVFGLVAGLPLARIALSGLLMGLIAQGGDLMESALKRAFGVKDASNLIPGHGGFMDRMDGVVAAAIAAALVGLWVDASAPASALFSWL
jgi:phosphatidate cytidylyltransferase